MYLGGGYTGERLNKLYLENVEEPTILEHLGKHLGAYATSRKQEERFGDYIVRTGIV